MPTIRPTTTTSYGWCVAERERTKPLETVELAFGLGALYRAYRKCRKGKRSAHNTQRYESQLLGQLITTRDALLAQRWQPQRTLAFVVSQPKAREIHAADFADRVVHHVLVEQLARLYERVFIFDSAANRGGRGTHFAVDRLQRFLRSATEGGAKPAYFLKLDIANFFNAIHRPTLYRMLIDRLAKDVRERRVSADVGRGLLAHCKALLRANPAANVHRRGSAARFASVPAHKRLGAVGPAFGLPIGNLTSQFFANVYLDQLDQFVKHELKVKHYVRYVDDFVLLAPDAPTLQRWQEQIIVFLRGQLSLSLRAFETPQPVANGIDFLGYVVRHQYRLVRRRVVNNCKQVLRNFEAAHVRSEAGALRVRREPAAVKKLSAQIASYRAQFAHANARNLWRSLQVRFPWLRYALSLAPARAFAPSPSAIIKNAGLGWGNAGCDQVFALTNEPPSQPPPAGGRSAIATLAQSAAAKPLPARLRYDWRMHFQSYPHCAIFTQCGNEYWVRHDQLTAMSAVGSAGARSQSEGETVALRGEAHAQRRFVCISARLTKALTRQWVRRAKHFDGAAGEFAACAGIVIVGQVGRARDGRLLRKPSFIALHKGYERALSPSQPSQFQKHPRDNAVDFQRSAPRSNPIVQRGGQARSPIKN